MLTILFQLLSFIWSSKTSTVQYIKAVRADSIPDTQRGRINKDVAAGLWSKTVS